MEIPNQNRGIYQILIAPLCGLYAAYRTLLLRGFEQSRNKVSINRCPMSLDNICLGQSDSAVDRRGFH
jgi:hypothetical protein